MFFSEKEQTIMKSFDNMIEYYGYNQLYKIKMKDDTIIIAAFDTCYETENNKDEEDPEYEEFMGYAFEIKKIIYVEKQYGDLYKEGKFFEISYHNYPKEIVPLIY